MPQVFENLVELSIYGLTVRVWCGRDEWGPHPAQHRSAVAEWFEQHSYDAHNESIDPDFLMTLAKRLCEDLRFRGVIVNALQVRIGDLSSLVYPDWP